jgi:hypothetical protein
MPSVVESLAAVSALLVPVRFTDPDATDATPTLAGCDGSAWIAGPRPVSPAALA